MTNIPDRPASGIDPNRIAHARARLPTAQDAARLSGQLSIMADPVRLRLLYALDIGSELCVGALALALQVSEDQVGYALRLLRAAGLVRTRKVGRIVYNSLAPDFPAASAPVRYVRSGRILLVRRVPTV